MRCRATRLKYFPDALQPFTRLPLFFRWTTTHAITIPNFFYDGGSSDEATVGDGDGGYESDGYLEVRPIRPCKRRRAQCAVPPRPPRKLEIVPGGLVRQPLSRDPGLIKWESGPKATFTIRVVNFEQFRSMTGREPPAPPQLPLNTRLPPRDERNMAGTDGIVVSNAEYQLNHPPKEPDYASSTTTLPTNAARSAWLGVSRGKAVPDTNGAAPLGFRGWISGNFKLLKGRRLAGSSAGASSTDDVD